MKKRQSIAGLILCCVMFCGCSPTSAPTESVTNTVDNTVNGVIDFSSSSTPGSSDSGSAGVEAFTRANYADLKMEMAAGSGEHVQALATLLDIPGEKRCRFFTLLKQEYGSLYPTPQTPPDVMLASLYTTMDAAGML